jgi:hypothetical protein
MSRSCSRSRCFNSLPQSPEILDHLNQRRRSSSITTLETAKQFPATEARPCASNLSRLPVSGRSALNLYPSGSQANLQPSSGRTHRARQLCFKRSPRCSASPVHSGPCTAPIFICRQKCSLTTERPESSLLTLFVTAHVSYRGSAGRRFVLEADDKVIGRAAR